MQMEHLVLVELAVLVAVLLPLTDKGMEIQHLQIQAVAVVVQLPIQLAAELGVMVALVLSSFA
jgi:hypothetical protein